jgi:AcrR family transcriptional regulator
MSPRSYDLGRRRPAAEATRERILEAARALVGGKGDLAEFSMEAVAAKAGVSRMTVYNQFESRTGLLEALADHLAVRGGMQRLREVFGRPDLEGAVRKFVEVFVGFWASDRTTLRRMRALGVLFPSLHRGLPARDAWRLEAARNLLARHGLAPAAPEDGRGPDAAELLAALTSFDVFDSLCREPRTPEDVARTISEIALRSLRPGRERAVAGTSRRSARR